MFPCYYHIRLDRGEIEDFKKLYGTLQKIIMQIHKATEGLDENVHDHVDSFTKLCDYIESIFRKYSDDDLMGGEQS